MFALQRLNTAQFIITDHPLTLVSQLEGLAIVIIDVADLLIRLLIAAGRQPVTAQMGLNIPLFLKDVRRDAARCGPQSFVPSVHRRFPGPSSG
jgi:hypothetical protein